ncbi:hypothetical protein [Metapseudomonas sp. CR1201]
MSLLLAFVIAWGVAGVIAFLGALAEHIEFDQQELRPCDWPFLLLVCIAFGMSILPLACLKKGSGRHG